MIAEERGTFRNDSAIAAALGKSDDAVKANLYRMRRAIVAGAPGLKTLLGA